MLRYFRINDPYRLLGLFIIVLMIGLPVFIDSPGITFPELKSMLVGEKVHAGNALYTELVDSTAPLAGWFDAFFDMIFGRSLLARHILTLFIILCQASYLGIVFIQKKAFSESTFIPSLLFGLLFFFSFDTFALSAELLGSGVLMLALNNLFRQIEFREQRDGSVFNLGFYIGIASLFSFSFIVHLAAAIVILVVFTRSTARNYLLLLFGFLLPHLLIMSIYFLNDGLAELWQYYYLPNLAWGSTRYISTGSLWTLGALPLAFLVVSLIMLNREARFTKYQSQLVQIMFFWMVFSFIQVLYSKDIRPQSFITLLPGISFFMAHFLLLIRRRKFAEMSIWILLVGVVSVHYLARYGHLNSVKYDNLFVGESLSTKEQPVSGKKVLMLGDDVAVYKYNTVGSSFLNWKLSREVFEQPDYYENIAQVYESFHHDPPEVIIDPNNLMQRFFEKIPALKERYVRVKPGWYELLKGVETKK